jgi:HK97 family phage major capsid protein
MSESNKSAEQLAAEVKSAYEAAMDKVKAVAEQALGEAKASGQIASKTKEEADEALLKMGTLQEHFRNLEQRLLEGHVGGQKRAKSVGEQFVESEKVKDFLGQARPRGRVDMEVKATLTSLTTGAGGVGDAIAPSRLPGVLPLPQRRMTVRDLLSQGQMDGNTLEYVKETGFTNNAAPVAEGALKPSSDIQFDLVSTSAKVIAHWMKASRQVLDDVAQLRSMIDERLLYGLAYVEENQLLNGDGTGQNLLGLIPQATAYAAPITLTSPTSIDMMRLAMLQAALAEYPATGHVMNPVDWAWIETLKDTQGRYIIGNPQGSITPTLWGLPVVTTQAIAVDKFLTGAFRLGAQVFDRWVARVEVATENENDFVMNVLTVLAEERIALAVYRPQSLVFGDFGRIA